MADNPIRILHVVGSLSGGGIQAYLLGLLAHLPHTEFQSEVLEMNAPEGPLAPDARRLGAATHCIATGRGARSFSQEFWALLTRGSYDVVHVHRSGGGMALPLAIAARCGVPVRIAHFQNVRRPPGGGFLRRIAEPMLRRVARSSSTSIIGVSRAVLASHLGAGYRTDPRCHLIPNAIDVEALAAVSAEGIREEIGIAPTDFVVGNVARFSAAKNHEALIAVASDLLRGGIPLRLLLVGDGERLASIRAMAEREGIADRVIFAGWRTDIPRLMKAMDVFLFPSRWEGLPLALLEAQACGVPCVASCIESNSEALAPEYADWTFQPSDTTRAASLVQRLHSNPQDRSRLAQAGSRHVLQFDIRSITNRIAAMYRQRVAQP